MDQVDIGHIIQQSIARFNQNRRGPRPLIFVTMPPNLPRVSWNDGALEKIVSRFLPCALRSGGLDDRFAPCASIFDLNSKQGGNSHHARKQSSSDP